MDARQRANFINSVAGGQKIPCPNCDALNEEGTQFCFMCGAPLEMMEETSDSGKTEKYFCMKCGTENEADAMFCCSCGEALNGTEISRQESIEEEEFPAQNENVIMNPVSAVESKVEELDAFAEGLPDWDLVPPQVVVRRKKR